MTLAVTDLSYDYGRQPVSETGDVKAQCGL